MNRNEVQLEKMKGSVYIGSRVCINDIAGQEFGIEMKCNLRKCKGVYTLAAGCV